VDAVVIGAGPNGLVAARRHPDRPALLQDLIYA
jgi:ribulose 1,5-bisphosphate synthetase/thiazole synthase